jgi:aerobic carbon-monoxide dehydrogenase medium subunit
MKPVAFEYVRARDLDSALAALREGGEASRPLAGGQSLGPMLNLRLARPALLVDIGRIAALRQVERRGDVWHLGAGVTHAMVEDGAGGLDGMPAAVARTIAYRAVRNRGTVGGSLAHADPAADWLLALAAMDARVVARLGRESREIAVTALATGAFATCLAPGELLTGIRIPALSPAARWGYAKACRKAGEFADAASAVVMDATRGCARIVLGALGGPPRLIDGGAALLERATGPDALPLLREAVARAAPELDAVDVALQAGTLARALSQARSPR